MHMCTHTHPHTCTRTRTHAHIPHATHTHTHTRTHTYTCNMQSCTHAHTHTRTHTYTHTHTHTHTHTRNMQSRKQRQPPAAPLSTIAPMGVQTGRPSDRTLGRPPPLQWPKRPHHTLAPATRATTATHSSSSTTSRHPQIFLQSSLRSRILWWALRAVRRALGHRRCVCVCVCVCVRALVYV